MDASTIRLRYVISASAALIRERHQRRWRDLFSGTIFFKAYAERLLLAYTDGEDPAQNADLSGMFAVLDPTERERARRLADTIRCELLQHEEEPAPAEHWPTPVAVLHTAAAIRRRYVETLEKDQRLQLLPVGKRLPVPVLALLESAEANKDRIVLDNAALSVEHRQLLDAALRSVGATYNKRSQAYVVSEDRTADAALEQLLLPGIVTGAWQRFDDVTLTTALADQMVAAASVGRGHNILIPAAGHGELLRALLRSPSGRGTHVVALEDNPECNAALRRLETPMISCDVGEGSYLSYRPVRKSFDRVVMTPPVSKAIPYITHAVSLPVIGRIVVVIGRHLLNRTDERFLWFRKLLEAGETEIIPVTGMRSSQHDIRAAMLVIRNTRMARQWMNADLAKLSERETWRLAGSL